MSSEMSSDSQCRKSTISELLVDDNSQRKSSNYVEDERKEKVASSEIEFHLREELESLLQKILRTIHSNHYLALAVKQRLLAGYRTEMSSVHPQKKILERMSKLCEEISVVLDITEPGISRMKGITLYEMHLPMAMLANRSYGAGQISSVQLALQLENAERLLQKALSNLLLEPVATPEGRLAKRALQELKLLRRNLSDVRALLTTVKKPKCKQLEGKTNIVRH